MWNVLQRDNAAADEILKDLMPVMITGRLVKIEIKAFS
jgi:hypothetical protein